MCFNVNKFSTFLFSTYGGGTVAFCDAALLIYMIALSKAAKHRQQFAIHQIKYIYPSLYQYQSIKPESDLFQSINKSLCVNNR